MNKEKMQKMYGNVAWTDKPHNFLGLSLNFTRYILTDKKLIERKGFLNIKEEKVDLYKIMDISMDLPLTQRIFGCGTIKLSSKDIARPVLDLSKIRDPYMVYNLIETTTDAQKKEYGVLGKDIYIPTGPVPGNPPESPDSPECPECGHKE